MNSTSHTEAAHSARTGRRVPSWASGLFAELSRDRPAVVTRVDLAERLSEIGSDRDVEATVHELRRLGWLVGLPVQGTWAFIPAGQDAVADPLLPLRAWRARDPHTPFMLAGATAAWHLGYLDRAPDGRAQVWLPSQYRLPDGLRKHVSVVRINWPEPAAGRLGPSTPLLLRRKLDLVAWADGLPALGPEALCVQLASRPASFAPWADLVVHLEQLASDCDDEHLVDLLTGQSASAWQRAAYLLHAGGQPARAAQLFGQRPDGPMPKVHFEHSAASRGREDTPALWVPQFSLIDRLIAPLQGLMSKA